MDMSSMYGMSSMGDMSSDMDMDDMDSMDGMMMQMTYYWGSNVTVLFTAWNTEGDDLYYSITLIFLFLAAVASEAWSAVSAYYRGYTTTQLHGVKAPTSKIATYIGTRQQNLLFFFGAFFYTIKLILGYQLMLAVMTYNVGISIAIFVGAFVGNFVFARFAWNNPKEEVDNIACHL